MTLRLGSGDFFDPEGRLDPDGDRWPADPVLEARRIFLWRITVIAPDVLVTLWDDVYPVYRIHVAPDQVATWKEEGSTFAQELDLGLLEWAEKWDLKATWIMTAALRTMGLWRRRDRFVNHFWSPAPRREALSTFRVEVVDWNPTQLKRSEWEASALRQFKAALKERGDQIEAEAEFELKITPKKNTDAHRGKSWRHFDWTIRRRIQKETVAEIAGGIERVPRTVRGSISEIEQLIGLR